MDWPAAEYLFEEKQYGKYPYEPTEHSSFLLYFVLRFVYFVSKQALAVCVHYGPGHYLLIFGVELQLFANF